MQKHSAVIGLSARLVLLAGLLAGLSVPASAQKGKIVKNLFEGLPKAAAEQKAASSLPKKMLTTPSAHAPYARVADSRQLYFRFQGEPVQLEIPFPTENLPAVRPENQVLQAQFDRLVKAQTERAQQGLLALPSGERVRVVTLGPEHFKHTHQLKATVNYLMRTTSKPVVLRIRQTGENVTVFMNDRLRYFTDVHRACPVGSYLLRYEDGRTTFLTPKQAPQSLKDAYLRASNALHFVFSSQDSAPKGSVKLPEVARLSDLFAPHSPYAQVTALVHPVTGQEVRAAKLQKSVRVAGMELLEAGSVVVAYPDGRFDFHPAGLVPPVLLAKLVPQDKVLQPAAESHPAVKTYDDQNQLARDLYHSGRPGKHYKSIGLGEVIAYEVPAGTYYRADGRKEMLLDPEQYVVIYIPRSNGGQILDKPVFENPLLFTPLP